MKHSLSKPRPTLFVILGLILMITSCGKDCHDMVAEELQRIEHQLAYVSEKKGTNAFMTKMVEIRGSCGLNMENKAFYEKLESEIKKRERDIPEYMNEIKQCESAIERSELDKAKVHLENASKIIPNGLEMVELRKRISEKEEKNNSISDSGGSLGTPSDDPKRHQTTTIDTPLPSPPPREGFESPLDKGKKRKTYKTKNNNENEY